jgi:hypothetical protein
MEKFLPDDKRKTVPNDGPRCVGRGMIRPQRQLSLLWFDGCRHAFAPQFIDPRADRGKIVGGAGSSHVSSARLCCWLRLSGRG